MRKNINSQKNSFVWDKESDLQYFESMQNTKLSGTPTHTAEAWNERAKFWKIDFSNPQKEKSKGRVESTIEYLKNRGILLPNTNLVDIGCGPGRFTVEFAKHAQSTLGLDISDKMIEMGKTYAEKENLNNVSFKVCDFQTLDIEKENFKNRFDIVFTSITPAINGMHALEKSMEMSRKYCFNITHIHSSSELRSRIMKEVFKKELIFRDSFWFYSLFNLLLLRGYYPETTYHIKHEETIVTPDEESAHYLMRQVLPLEEHTPENIKLIEKWINENINDDGQLIDASDTWYGRTLWDITIKTDRLVKK